MKIGWLLGWAVPEAWFEPLAHAAFPNAIHAFFPATPDALRRLEEAGPFDWIAGYSLGTLLLLGHAAEAGHWGKVALLAPIFAFPREADLGGRVFRGQLRHLARQLARDLHGPLANFYLAAGLDVPDEAASSLTSKNLLWGLERLENDAVKPPLPAGWRAWCGADDALLDAAQLHAIDPSVTIVDDATHHPRALLSAFAKEMGR
jgi:hypothetical protein